MPLNIAFEGSDFINPHSLWSLWVPLVLLGLIGLAALYFSRIRIR